MFLQSANANFITVSVQIEVFNNVDSHPSRNFKLEWPTYQIRVGRGSMSGGKELYPAEDNAWFESRVMSRAHAVLQTDPVTRVRSRSSSILWRSYLNFSDCGQRRSTLPASGIHFRT